MGNLNCKSSNEKDVITNPRKDISSPSTDSSQIINNETPLKISETTIPSSIKEDDFAIPIKIYKPQNIPLKASVFFIHGGVFSSGDRHSHPTIAEGLAKLGLVVVTASFRNGQEAPHKTNITMRDLRDVIFHVKETWDIPFGLVGSSSVSILCS